MNTILNRIFSVAALATVMGVGAAQAGQQASFHLPFEAKWGNVVLQPGDYKVDLPQLSVGPRQFYVNGENARGYVPPMATDTNPLRLNQTNRSFLRLQKVDGMFYVTKFESGLTGTSFSFRAPKPAHKVQMSSVETLTLGVSGN